LQEELEGLMRAEGREERREEGGERKDAGVWGRRESRGAASESKGQ
jgi:hypothetical protein